jgi:NADH ubiquinone oxidoreductase, 20 Kd subunit
MIAGKSVREEIIEAARNAKAVIAFGSCSSWGGLPAAAPNPTVSHGITDIFPAGTKVARVPGCAPITEVMIATLLHVHFHDELPELDKKLRPKAFYQSTVHMTATGKLFSIKSCSPSRMMMKAQGRGIACSSLAARDLPRSMPVRLSVTTAALVPDLPVSDALKAILGKRVCTEAEKVNHFELSLGMQKNVSCLFGKA